MTDETELVETQELEQAQQDETQQQQSTMTLYTITILLPAESATKQVQVQATSLETVNDIQQSLTDLVTTNQFTCFRLEYNGTILNEYVELSSIEGLPPKPEFKLIESPYTERDSRLHISRVLDFLAGNMATELEGQTNFDMLQQKNATMTDLLEYAPELKDPTKALTTHDSPNVPVCLKSLAISPWSPASKQYKNRGHLLYLVVNTLEDKNIHITSSVAGYWANNCTVAKFDPSPRPGAKTFHSLSRLLQQESPKFKEAYVHLEKYMNARDPILTVPIVNAHPAQPWMTSVKDQSRDAMDVQRAWLDQGLENNDSLRDWNEELQTTRELPSTPLNERILRSRLLQKTLHDFAATAAKGAELLVKGELIALNPTEESDAQMYIYSNIFFSRGLDGVGTFLRDGGDAAAHKAVALDVNGVRILSTLDVDGLSILGTCVVDYAGERIVAQSIVPGIFRQRAEDESQIIYGGVDGRDVVATDSACDELFKKVASALKLKRHPVFEKQDDVRKELELSIETKGLAGADGRKYILDLYRICPVDIEFLEAECESPNENEFVSIEQSRQDEVTKASTKYPHRMTLLRYELLEAYWEQKLNEHVSQKLQTEDATKQDPQKALENGNTNGNGTEPGHELLDPSIESVAEDTRVSEPAENEKLKSGTATDDDTPAQQSTTQDVDISDFKLLFNPDTFHARQSEQLSEEDQATKEADENVVRNASKFLRETVIPQFVEDLKEARVATPMDSASLAKVLHKRGINIRYLGHILKLAETDSAGAKYSALITIVKRDIVIRSAKHVLAKITKGMPFALLSSAISHFLNCLLETHEPVAVVDSALHQLYPTHLSFMQESVQSIQGAVKTEALRRFRYTLEENWQTETRGLPLLRGICLAFGVQLRAKAYFSEVAESVAETEEPSGKRGKKSKAPAPPKVDSSPRQLFTPEDIVGILPIIKDATPRSGLAEEAMEAGRLCIVQGDKNLGMELLLESLSLHEQIYGVLHPEAARGYNALALIYNSLGDRNTALELGKKAVVVAERTLGLDHSETILYYLNLALYEHGNGEGNTKQALAYIHHALTLWRIIFGFDHPDMITTINNVAVMLQCLKQFPESLKWFLDSARICESLYGNKSVNAATLYFQIAQAKALVGDAQGAVDTMKESNAIFEKTFGKDDNNAKESWKWVQQLVNNCVEQKRQGLLRSDPRTNGTEMEQDLRLRSADGSRTKASGDNQLRSQTKLQKQSILEDNLTGSRGTEPIEKLAAFIQGSEQSKLSSGAESIMKKKKVNKKSRK